MRKLLLLLLFSLPLQADAARLFVRANGDKIIPSEGVVPNYWTLAVWFKLASQPSNAAYIIFNDGGGLGLPNPLLYYDDAAGVKEIYISTSSSFGVYHASTYTVTLTVGQWYHIAIVAGSGFFKLYLDGVDTTWTTNSALANETQGGTAGIGVMRWGTDINNFDGTIGPVARWCCNSTDGTQDTLNAAEVLALARGVSPEKIRPVASGTSRRYVWPLEGWQTTEPDIGARHSAPATLTGAARADGPPLVPR